MISETCERFCMFYHKIKNSTGMSAHKTLIQAFENSRKEVAERNFIKDLYFDSSIKPIFNINEGEVNYSFYKLNEDYYFSICRVRSRSCYSYGVSVGSNLEGLKQKSFLEAIMLNSFYTKSLIKGRVAAIESHFIDERNIVALDLVCFLGRYRYVVGIKDVK
ncbi:hypothetical protein [Acinetobacter higginsii]|uniref:hypothetical protein n=1 Tax=Acinetobacter higginsii TaxID=70347 RepID=UPI0026763827|nr:hypothetical protein [Acinetobacter higginsii]MDO3664898.1 hypothetical protein [Acinetobacter higginsii]